MPRDLFTENFQLDLHSLLCDVNSSMLFLYTLNMDSFICECLRTAHVWSGNVCIYTCMRQLYFCYVNEFALRSWSCARSCVLWTNQSTTCAGAVRYCIFMSHMEFALWEGKISHFSFDRARVWLGFHFTTQNPLWGTSCASLELFCDIKSWSQILFIVYWWNHKNSYFYLLIPTDSCPGHKITEGTERNCHQYPGQLPWYPWN